MLQVVNISKSYGSEVILEDVSFVVNAGERAGLIGPNGSGKSTLLRIVAGVEQADTGRVILGSGTSAAWLPQGFEVDPAQTLGEAVRRGLEDHTSAHRELLRIEKSMSRAAGSELDALLEERVPGVRKAMRWNTPFYGIEGQGWFLAFYCYKRYVQVTFLNGARLEPVPPKPSKAENVRYLEIHEHDDLEEARLVSWIEQAASLPGERVF